MKIFKRILAVLCWTLIAGGVINLFTNSAYGMFPMSLALIVLLFRWGKDLWFVDPATIYMDGWKRGLIYVGYHICIFLVCALIGVTISIFIANGDPLVTNWIFFLATLILGLCIHPKKYIPRHIYIQNGVTSIENSAFSERNSLRTATIGKGVTSIGENPFDSCRKLKAFYGEFASADNRCLITDGVLKSFAPAGLTEYSIPNNTTSIGELAFHNCTSLKSITIPDSVTSIGDSAFCKCISLKSVTIPDSVTSIESNAFYCCGALTSVTIGNGVASIGKNAFYGCISLTSISIPNGVASIEDNTFYGCRSLTSITIPDSVTVIGNDVFNDCFGLTSVTIGKGVTSIGEGAFLWCTSLTSVFCKAITPPSRGDLVFYNNASDIKIYVPRESVEAYKTRWNEYADNIVGYDF